MLSDLIVFLGNPLVWKILACYWIFSAAVSPMPAPKQESAPFYVWFFGFLHALAGNLNRAALALKVPGANELP